MTSLADPIGPPRRAGMQRGPLPLRGAAFPARTQRSRVSSVTGADGAGDWRKARAKSCDLPSAANSANNMNRSEGEERPKRKKTRSRATTTATAAAVAAPPEDGAVTRGSRTPRQTAAGVDAYRATSRYLSHATTPLTPRGATGTPPPHLTPRQTNTADRPPTPTATETTATTTPSLPTTLTPRNRVSPDVFNKEPRGASATPPFISPRGHSDEFLIPAARPQFADKLVVVLDLDETLVSSRDTSVIVRPGTDLLLQSLKDNCELIVWTAGAREYALDVIRQIDPYLAIQHCIYRHPMWWNGENGCVKDLRMLGRPLDKVVFIDNTPDVFRANPANSILVSDFDGTGTATDRVLVTLADMFDQVFRRFPNPTAADVFASRRLKARTVPLDNGAGLIELNTVADDLKVMSHSFGPHSRVRYSVARSCRHA